MIIGKRYIFTSDCTMSLDVSGTLVDILPGTEEIYVVNTGTKIIKIGSKHPRLKIHAI